jgi:hypothetical protein
VPSLRDWISPAIKAHGLTPVATVVVPLRGIITTAAPRHNHNRRSAAEYSDRLFKPVARVVKPLRGGDFRV